MQREQTIAVVFDQFSVSGADRVDLFDSPVPRPSARLASLFGEFTCDEHTHDCEMMDHDPQPATAVGAWASTGRYLFIHFATLVMMRKNVRSAGSAGWTLRWAFSGSGAPCALDRLSAPAHATLGTCNSQ
eukprot:SAG31_NODE_26255_length_445_cov_1.479769_1_plen_129_part_10